jgi:hypothetical protein
MSKDSTARMCSPVLTSTAWQGKHEESIGIMSPVTLMTVFGVVVGPVVPLVAVPVVAVTTAVVVVGVRMLSEESDVSKLLELGKEGLVMNSEEAPVCALELELGPMAELDAGLELFQPVKLELGQEEVPICAKELVFVDELGQLDAGLELPVDELGPHSGGYASAGVVTTVSAEGWRSGAVQFSANQADKCNRVPGPLLW